MSGPDAGVACAMLLSVKATAAAVLTQTLSGAGLAVFAGLSISACSRMIVSLALTANAAGVSMTGVSTATVISGWLAARTFCSMLC